MTIFLTLWQRAARERNELRRLNDQLRHDIAVERARANTAETRAGDADARCADLEGHLELMTIDLHDLEREVEILTSGLRWFEGETA